jgi:hypothetical protein
VTVEYIFAVDPGKATGVAFGRITDVEAVEVIYAGIIPGGTSGFIEWLNLTDDGYYVARHDCEKYYPEEYNKMDYQVNIVSEVFQAKMNPFVPDLEPVRIEGVLIDRFGKQLNWQKPLDKSLVGDEFLKLHDLWLTGAGVGHTDGRDANDALLHMFAYLMKRKHLPTLSYYWR